MAKVYKCKSGLYSVSTKELEGFCFWPNNPCPIGILWIPGWLRGKRRLGAFIHEWLHAELPDVPHDVIYGMESTLTDILWDQGYRRKQEQRR